MKVLITTPYYLPNVSGITIYVQVLAEELVKKGHQVTILTNRHDPSTKKEESVNGVKIKRLKINFMIGKGAISFPFLIQSIKEIWDSDVVNCHLPQPESLWVVVWGNLLNKKIFLSHHTDLSFWKGWKNKLIDSGVFACQYLAALGAEKIISYTKDYAVNSYFLKNFLKKVVEIYPPIRFEKRKNVGLQKRIYEITKNKKYVIGFCGRIAKQKGIELLIEASTLLDKEIGKNNFVFLMAGPTKIIGENYYEYLDKKYKKILKEKFVFLGNIERKFLSNFYEKLDLLVLPSDDTLESFGWVQIEAMKCGTPCVATNLPGMRVPVKETGFGILFETRNKIDLAKKIKIILLKRDNKNFEEKQNRVETFDYRKSIDKYEKMFLKAVKI